MILTNDMIKEHLKEDSNKNTKICREVKKKFNKKIKQHSQNY